MQATQTQNRQAAMKREDSPVGAMETVDARGRQSRGEGDRPPPSHMVIGEGGIQTMAMVTVMVVKMMILPALTHLLQETRTIQDANAAID